MNTTHHGRWNRYRVTDHGVKEKICNGPLHPEGEWLPLGAYFIFKKGPRRGKPENYCKDCCKTKYGRDPMKSGYVPVGEVKWIFIELQRRLGKTETVRRLNLSDNFWRRIKVQENFKKVTVERAMKLLLEVRKAQEVRHRKSIRYGAAARGKKERAPVTRRDFYVTDGDEDLNRRKNYREEHLEQERIRDRERRRRKKQAVS